jgi:hypothetical protein
MISASWLPAASDRQELDVQSVSDASHAAHLARRLSVYFAPSGR